MFPGQFVAYDTELFHGMQKRGRGIVRTVQAQVVLQFRRDRGKQRPWADANSQGEGATMDFQRIDPGGQFDPNQKAGFGSRYARARWEAGVNPGDDGPHTFRNPQLQVAQVPVIISAGEDLVRRGVTARAKRKHCCRMTHRRDARRPRYSRSPQRVCSASVCSRWSGTWCAT